MSVLKLNFGNLPWISALALIIPVVRMLWFKVNNPGVVSIWPVLGCGAASLGYVLVIAAIFEGKFAIFRLQKRINVVLVAFCVLCLAALLSHR